MKKLIAILAVGAALTLSACAPASKQDQANNAAKQGAALAEQQAGGADVSQQAQSVEDTVAKQTGCKVVLFEGGPVPSGPSRTAFVDQLHAGVQAYQQAHPGSIVGEYEGQSYGAVIILDCSGA